LPSSEDLAISSTVTLLKPFLKNKVRADLRISFCGYLSLFLYVPEVPQQPSSCQKYGYIKNFSQYVTIGQIAFKTINI
jgi:hypothetical protein